MSETTNSRPATVDPVAVGEIEKLTAYFGARHPDSEVRISNYRKAPSGFSNETRFFTLDLRRSGETSSRELVARWSPTGHRQFLDYDLAFQYRAMQALADTTVPVPQVLLFETDTSFLGGPFFVMAKADGQTTSDYPPGYHGAGYLFEASPQERREVWWRSLEVMANLHGIDWRKPAFSFLKRPRDGAAALRGRIALMQRLAAWASATPIPSIERSFEWLQARLPNPRHLTLCWSDPRPGNILFKDYRPVVALDWEGLYAGPPENDLAYFILVDEVAYKAHGQSRLAGLPDAEETIARYEALTGRKAENLGYCFVMQATWLAIMMAISAKNVLALGITGFPEDYASNNVSTARLDGLLAQAG